jgi:hypothetical protein
VRLSRAVPQRKMAQARWKGKVKRKVTRKVERKEPRKEPRMLAEPIFLRHYKGFT